MEIDNKLILENSRDLNVLYVEDDETLRTSVEKLLQNFFINIDIAVDGEDGYKKYLEKIQTPYDIVFTDINMPKMSGLDMCEKIKKLNFEQKIVLITAFDEPEYLHAAIKFGVNGFLTKPLDGQKLKEIVYLTSKSISDSKLLKTYYKMLEDANMLTIDMKDSSSFNSSNDILDDLEKNKEKISLLWSNTEEVGDILKKHTIDTEYFRTHYGIKVIEYFLDVIKGESEIGNCPVIMTMIDFFKHKDLPLKDIFMICVHFKNTITAYIFNNYSFNRKLYDDISIILDRNFEGVIVNYLKVKGISKSESKVVIPEKKEDRYEITEDIDYNDYVLENDIYELQDLEQDIDSLAISVTMSNSTSDECRKLANLIKRYGEILNNYPIFAKLGESIVKLGLNLSDNSELLINDEQKMSNITALIECFVNDLIIWRKEIFENNIKDYHFLDSSFFSNVDTIIMFIEYDDTADESEDGDIEFF